MNDAEMINQSGYRRAFRYLRNSVQQSSRNARFSSPAADKDLAAVDKVSNKTTEIVFFPSYARHPADANGDLHVNVHGWLFSPTPAGQQSRRNRYTMLLARSIAGLPALPASQGLTSASVPSLLESELGLRPSTADTCASSKSQPVNSSERFDDASCSQDDHSDYPELYEFSDGSEPPTPNAISSRANSFPFTSKLSNGAGATSSSIAMRRQGSADSGATSSARFTRHFSDHDLVNCHANLTTRISPFLSKAVVGRGIKVDLLADGSLIGSSNLFTSENGHFRGVVKVPKAKLDSKNLEMLKAEVIEDDISASCEIRVIRDAGVSVISDVDDTVKHTNIVAGMREAFRNAFVRDLYTLEISGVRRWYHAMTEMGCTLHYVSNAPYQLWPCIAAYIKVAGLPAGTIHLKQYSGFLQGMFEPAAEKKRANVEKILSDFPERRFLLVGDSGEQDLELYSELAHSRFSKQILGIFIRDVSSSGTSALASPVGETGESFFSPGQGDNVVDNSAGTSGLHTLPEIASPPRLPPRPHSNPLIDLDVVSSHEEDFTSAVGTVKSGSHDILQAFSKDAVENSDRVDAPKRSLTEMTLGSDKGTTASLKSRPTLPRKPTALKFWSKMDGTNTFEKKDTLVSPASTTTPDRTPTTAESIKSNNSATPKARPGLLRSLSGNTYYNEGRKAQERTQAWELRLARARAILPDSIKLYVWKEGGDCQQHAEELIRKALKQQHKT